MGLHHGFNIIGNQVTRRQNVVHTIMSLGQAVAAADNTEFHGHAASFRNAAFYSFGQFTQADTAGHKLTVGIGNTYHRAGHSDVVETHGFVDSPVEAEFRSL